MPGTMDSSLQNRHRLIIGTSGSGKSSYLRALLQGGEKPRRLVAWDPDQDYDLPRVESVSVFVRHLGQAVKSGKGFRIAVTVRPTVENFERVCQALWAVADAARPIAFLVEELADVSAHAGKATPAWGELIRKGRKYGLTIWAVSQSPTEISKTIYRNVGCKVALCLESKADRQTLAAVMDLRISDFEQLAPLEYWEKWTGPEPAGRGRIVFSRGKPRLQPGA